MWRWSHVQFVALPCLPFAVVVHPREIHTLLGSFWMTTLISRTRAQAVSKMMSTTRARSRSRSIISSFDPYVTTTDGIADHCRASPSPSHITLAQYRAGPPRTYPRAALLFPCAQGQSCMRACRPRSCPRRNTVCTRAHHPAVDDISRGHKRSDASATAQALHGLLGGCDNSRPRGGVERHGNNTVVVSNR
jgi:hypothetical protein